MPAGRHLGICRGVRNERWILKRRLPKVDNHPNNISDLIEGGYD
jgi:hypothetical protein